MSASVSVVIPTHNRRRLLIQTLESVARQRGLEIEVLVVDDGSVDGTADAVRALNDPRIRVIRHDAPRGVASARNAGASAASGSWIALLDDDDIWAPDKLVRQVGAAGETNRDWVYAGVVEIDERGCLLGGSPPPTPETLLAHLANRNLMPAGCSNVLVGAELFTRAGRLDPGLRHLADWDLWLRLAQFGPPACVAEPLVAYRVHSGQASLDPSDMIREARVLEARHGADRASIYRWLAWSYLRLGRRRKALRAYAGAVRAGDVASLARATVAALHPRPTSFRRPPSSSEVVEWMRRALEWLPVPDGC